MNENIKFVIQIHVTYVDDSGLRVRWFRLDDTVLKPFAEKLGVEVDHLWNVLTTWDAPDTTFDNGINNE